MLLLAAASLGVRAAVGESGRSPAAPGHADGQHAVVVARAGDTLWSIASRAEPGSDVRPLVAQLQAELGGRPLQAGDPVVVPLGH